MVKMVTARTSAVATSEARTSAKGRRSLPAQPGVPWDSSLVAFMCSPACGLWLGSPGPRASRRGHPSRAQPGDDGAGGQELERGRQGRGPGEGRKLSHDDRQAPPEPVPALLSMAEAQAGD